jgi:hypothetical protein
MSKHQVQKSAEEIQSSSSKSMTQSASTELAEYLDFSSIGKTFAELIKGVKLIDPFFSREIVVFFNKNEDIWDKNADFSSIMSIPKNKPFNVLLYWSSLKTLDGKELDHRKEFFDTKIDSERSVKHYVKSMKSFVFMILLLWTRGTVPSIEIKNQTNSLPRLLINNLGFDSKATEQDFAEMFSGVDVRKVAMNPFLDISPKELPAEIKNRIKLGFAGSRILKLFIMSKKYYTFADPRNNIDDLYDMMIEIASSGTSYKNAHPLVQKVQSGVPGFYVKMICVIAEAITEENWSDFLIEVKKISSFKADKILNDLVFTDGQVDNSFNTSVEGYRNLNANTIKRSYGELVEFD